MSQVEDQVPFTVPSEAALRGSGASTLVDSAFADESAFTVDPISPIAATTATPNASAPTATGPKGRGRPQSKRRWLIEWGVILVAAISVAVLVRATVVQAFYIPSPSMVPTLKVHDRLLVDKVTFHVRDIRRGRGHA